MRNLALEDKQESEFADDYKKSLARLIPLIEKNLDTNIKFGPTYNVSTSQNKVLKVITLIADQNMSPERFAETAPSRQYILLAIDENDSIIGYKSCDLYARQSDYMVTTFITTGKRGEGLSTPIDMAFIDILERESCRLGNNIEWYVSNKSDRANTDMQARWNSHYAHYGSVFGSSPKARPREKTRTFSPSPNPLKPLESIANCTLKRTIGPEQELQIERSFEQPSFDPQDRTLHQRTQLEIYISNTRELL